MGVAGQRLDGPGVRRRTESLHCCRSGYRLLHAFSRNAVYQKLSRQAPHRRPVHGIKPLAISNHPPEIGDVLRLTGYGSVTSTTPVQETHLRTGQLSVLTVEDTIIGVEGFPPANDTTPCPYDSGRPFIIEQLWRSPKLVSVVSNGPSCPHSAKESSARVDNPKEWVEDAIVADAQSRLSSRWRRAGEEIHTRFSVNLEAVFTALAGRENWRSRSCTHGHNKEALSERSVPPAGQQLPNLPISE